MITKIKGYGAWEWVDTMPHCTNDCAQGAKPCPTPVACRVLRDDPLEPARGIARSGGCDEAEIIYRWEELCSAIKQYAANVDMA